MVELGSWVAQLRKGVVDLMVLRLIARVGDLHGYAIVRELRTRSGLEAGESTVYPVLRRLEADGLLDSRWVAADGGPPRKYYGLTGAGTGFLARAGAEWDALVASVETLKGEGGHGGPDEQ